MSDPVAKASKSLTLDLPLESRRLVKLLIAVDCFPHGGLYNGPYTRTAVERYVTYWLPLLAAHPHTNLVPPLDVAYAWLCHRLAPAAYAADCIKLFGRVLHPSTPEQALAFDDGSASQATQELWGTVHTNPSQERPAYFPPKAPTSVTLALAGFKPSKLTDADLDQALWEFGPGGKRDKSDGKKSDMSDVKKGGMSDVKKGGSSDGGKKGGMSGGQKGDKSGGQKGGKSGGQKGDMSDGQKGDMCDGEKGDMSDGPGLASHAGWRPELRCDVAGAMARQGGFLRHVLRASYSELPFLQRAVDRYLKFVLLWRDSPGLEAVPMYDIDLMWHAHMAHSGAYQQDMQAIAGKVLNHDDALGEDHLSSGFLATKAAFEARWDMLYDPPLTRRVPESQQHPAQRVVGAPLGALLAGPLVDDVRAVMRARHALSMVSKVKEAGKLARSYREMGIYSESGQDSLNAIGRTHGQQIVAKKVGAACTVAYHAAEKARADAIAARTVHERTYPPQGGAALYCLSLVARGLRQGGGGNIFTACLSGSSPEQLRCRANRVMVDVMKHIPSFKRGATPFSQSHPFWTEFSLVPHDSPVTLYRTPPGSLPGTLAATLATVAASKGQAVSPSVGVPSVAVGTPVANPVAPGMVVPTTISGAVKEESMQLSTSSLLYPSLSPRDLALVETAMGAGYCPYDSCALGGPYAVSADAAGRGRLGDVGDVGQMPAACAGGAAYCTAVLYSSDVNDACAQVTKELAKYSSVVSLGVTGHAGGVEYGKAEDTTAAQCASSRCGPGSGTGGGCGTAS